MHLKCAQLWAKFSAFRPTALSEEAFPMADTHWRWYSCYHFFFLTCSPNCKTAYLKAETPGIYFCYCGKMKDPVFDVWITPHSVP